MGVGLFYQFRLNKLEMVFLDHIGILHSPCNRSWGYITSGTRICDSHSLMGWLGYQHTLTRMCWVVPQEGSVIVTNGTVGKGKCNPWTDDVLAG